MYIDYNKRFLARKMNVGNTCSRHAHKKNSDYICCKGKNTYIKDTVHNLAAKI